MQKIRREASVCSNLCPVWMMAGQELKEIDHLIVDVTFFSLSPPPFLPQELYWEVWATCAAAAEPGFKFNCFVNWNFSLFIS